MLTSKVQEQRTSKTKDQDGVLDGSGRRQRGQPSAGVDIGGAGAMADDGEAAGLLADEIEDNATM